LIGARHVILLTDGVFDPPPGPEWRRLIQAGRAAGIRLTTVALGSDADDRFLANCAQWADPDGTYLKVDTKIAELPQIFVREIAEVVAETEAADKRERDERLHQPKPPPIETKELQWIAVRQQRGLGLFRLGTDGKPMIPDVGDPLRTTLRDGAWTAFGWEKEFVQHPVLAFGRLGAGQIAHLAVPLDVEPGRRWAEWDALADVVARTLDLVRPAASRLPAGMRFYPSTDGGIVRFGPAEPGKPPFAAWSLPDTGAWQRLPIAHDPHTGTWQVAADGALPGDAVKLWIDAPSRAAPRSGDPDAAHTVFAPPVARDPNVPSSWERAVFNERPPRTTPVVTTHQQPWIIGALLAFLGELALLRVYHVWRRDRAIAVP
jgi:hypothetical protein